MSNISIVLLVVGLTLGIGLTILVLFPLLKKKGVKTEEVLEKTDKVLSATDGVLKVADTLFPNNPAISILKVIDNYVHKGLIDRLNTVLNAEPKRITHKEAITILKESGKETAKQYTKKAMVKAVKTAIVL